MNLQCFNPQFFMASRVGDAALEADYGPFARRFTQQMNIIIDAMRALSVAVPQGQMLPGDRLALDRLQELAQNMDQSGTADHKVAVLSTAEVDDLIWRLRAASPRRTRITRQDPSAAQ